MSQPTVLITNDDGIESPLMRVLCEAFLAKNYKPYVVAPHYEQSWISRAVSRFRKVSVHPATDYPCEAWSVEGTPTDCVNLALGNLLPEKPIAVISGINKGYNATLPLILASGTVAGALEGALWGIPSFALSYQYFPVQKNQTEEEHIAGLMQTLKIISNRSVELIRNILEETQKYPANAVWVHNFNFPHHTTEETSVIPASIQPLHLGGFFKPTEGKEYEFVQPPIPHEFPEEQHTDLALIRNQKISYSILNYSALSYTHSI